MITIAVQRLKNLLKFVEVSKSVIKKDDRFDRVLITPTDKGLHFTTISNSIIKTSSCFGDYKLPKPICVKYTDFSDAVNSFKTDVGLQVEKSILLVMSGNREMMVKIENDHQIDTPDPIPYTDKGIPSVRLKESIKAAKRFLGDDLRYLLSHFNLNQNELTTSNGVVLFVEQLPLHVSGLISADAGEVIEDLPLGEVFIGETDTHIGFKCLWAEAIVPKSRGSYPPYKNVIPTTYTKSVEFRLDDLKSFVDMKKINKKDDISLLFDLKNNKATISFVDKSGRKPQGTIPAPANLETKILLGHSVLRYVIHSCDGESVVWSLSNQDSDYYMAPISIVNGHRTIVFMPRKP